MLNMGALNSRTNYTIFLRNESRDTKNFWLFLEKPNGLSNNEIYANSSVYLSVSPNDRGTNTIVIPTKYSLGAGASSKAVGLGVQIDSNVVVDAELKQTWEAHYASTPPKQGANLNLVQGQGSPDNSIVLLSNSFDKAKNESDNWYSNASFGIQTQNGFLGVTWSPYPNEQCLITPNLSFYIATGSFKSNELADLATISGQSAKVELRDFKNFEVTVTLNSRGQWMVQPGRVQEI
ncbi:hypothetical protein [Flavobacterium pectinovorum]|uniref:Uncharacterized protein n=1 Tax=Flavobacterium pectinovorum TaxID=29533 RepID=A0A502EQD7_9FLAO|nr:hypothetical protein [Flavobacterium pectinovorum]TPG39993.1 hypothetical protein EAH81_11885 [Flavobacterium pectinovorum]